MKFKKYIISEVKVEKGSIMGKTPQEFDKALNGFMKGCQKKIDDDYKINYPKLKPNKLEMKEGPKFIKIISKAQSGAGTSAWAFIDKGTGDVLRPASWRAPAKHARGNIFDQDNGMRTISPYGPAYLK